MLFIVTPCASSEATFHTPFGKLYNKPPRTRDRIMPTITPYYNKVGTVQFGVNSYIQNTTITPDFSYAGPFAMADLPRIEKLPPWERIIK